MHAYISSGTSSRAARASTGWRGGFTLLAVFFLTPPPSASAALGKPTAGAVETIFQSRCVGCHGPDETSGGLRLDSYEAIMRGGERGPVVVPGNPSVSLLMNKILRRDRPAMPPRKPLAPAEVRTLRRWIASGAAAW